VKAKRVRYLPTYVSHPDYTVVPTRGRSGARMIRVAGARPASADSPTCRAGGPTGGGRRAEGVGSPHPDVWIKVQLRLSKGLGAAVAAGLLLAPAAHASVSFQASQPYAASSPWWIAAIDLDANGRADLVTASNSTNVISGLLSNADGSLQAPKNTPAAPSNLNAIAAGNLNGDAKGDVAVAVNGNPGSVRVYLGGGDGTFDAGTPYAVGAFPQDVVITQLDANASPDIAVANQTSHNVSVFLNDGTGTFTPAPGSPVVDPNGNDFLGIGAADFDADGNTDLVAGGVNGTSPGVYFFKGSASGAFAPPVPLGGGGSQKPETGDVNGDGRPDIVASRPGVGDVTIIKRTATGFDTPVVFDPDGPGGTNGRMALADLDGDGALDMAVPYTSGSQADKILVALGSGNGTFAPAGNLAVGSFPRQVAAADLNGDGNVDLASANSGTTAVTVLLAIPPSVSVTPAPLGFGDQARDTTSAQKTVDVRNTGGPRLRPSAVSVTGANASQFAITTDTCTRANLAPDQSCAIGVKFTPTGLGARSATLVIASNGGGSPHTVALTGNGALLPGSCANRLDGTSAADTLAGTPAGDDVFGLAGNDKLSGGAGNDCLDGGTGNDKVSGGDGNDKLKGGKGDDKLSGGTGKNSYSGASGNDSISARNGKKEKVDCGSGNKDRATVDHNDKVKGCEKVKRAKQ
jgi:Ca2+-binding RTX toxin-like protein